MNDIYHKSVLLKEVLDALSIKEGEKYIDATLGGGGHAEEILKRGGVVLGIDVDEDAISYVKAKLGDNQNLFLENGNFSDIDSIAEKHGFREVSGILMDLGVSSHQIDDETRGFSYQKDTALDMRMNKNLNVKAADLLNILSKGELYEIFSKYAQEGRSHAISNSIVKSRRIKAFEKAGDLTDIVEKIYGIPGTTDMKKKAQVNNKIFQALRIVVNDELSVLSQALPKAVNLLKSGGRLCVISFHSLEDRTVKLAFQEFESNGLGFVVTKKPIVPLFSEASENRRSRSAKLRVFARLDARHEKI